MGLRSFGRNWRDEGGVLFVSTNVDQGVIGITSNHAIVFDEDIRRRTVDDWHAEVVVKSEVLWARPQGLLPLVRSLAKSQVPFPDRGRVVVAALEDVCDRRFLGVDDQRRCNGSGPPNAPAVVSSQRILTGQQCVAGRRTNRRNRMGVRETAPLGCESINVGRFYFGRAIAPKIPVPEVICKDQNDVGRVVGCVHGRIEGGTQKNEAGKWGQEDGKCRWFCHCPSAESRQRIHACCTV